MLDEPIFISPVEASIVNLSVLTVKLPATASEPLIVVAPPLSMLSLVVPDVSRFSP